MLSKQDTRTLAQMLLRLLNDEPEKKFKFRDGQAIVRPDSNRFWPSIESNQDEVFIWGVHGEFRVDHEFEELTGATLKLLGDPETKVLGVNTSCIITGPLGLEVMKARLREFLGQSTTTVVEGERT